MYCYDFIFDSVLASLNLPRKLNKVVYCYDFIFDSVLASLNLPAAIEDVSGSNKVPQSVLDKAKQVQDQGGMQHLDKLINDLPELLCRNREILDDVSKTNWEFV